MDIGNPMLDRKLATFVGPVENSAKSPGINITNPSVILLIDTKVSLFFFILPPFMFLNLLVIVCEIYKCVC